MYGSELKRVNTIVDGLKPETFNAIVNSLKDKPLTQPGFSFADRQTTIRPSKTLRNYFYFVCEEPLIERCVFGATDPANNDESGFNDPCILQVDHISSSSTGSVFGLFTNIDAYNPTDGFGRCKAIDFYEPTLLFVSDIAFFPTIGMPCGPDESAWGISANSKYGLLCISGPDDDNNVWCIRTPDPLAVIGTVFENPISAYSNNTLGEGFIQLQYRNLLNELVNATGPNGSPLILPVFNTSKSTTYQANQFIKAICVSGVGLVILDSQSLSWGRARANIAHYTAGLVDIYTGPPGEETWDGLNSVNSFNPISDIVQDEWVFLVPTGNQNIPYYIVNNEYGGRILGKAINDVEYGDGITPVTVEVQIYGGTPGEEYDFGTTITAQVKDFFGAITKDTWVQCIFVGPDATANNGEWYVTATQRGNIFAGQVMPGSANPNNGYSDVDNIIFCKLLTGKLADQATNIQVESLVLYSPVLDDEKVQLEWNGDVFIITRAELDGGFWATTQQSEIANNSSGYVALIPTGNSQVVAPSLKVDTKQGLVEQGREVFIFRNRGGLHIASKSCS